MTDDALPRRTLGELSITALSDGYLDAGLETLAGIDPAAAAQIQAAAGIAEPGTIHINSYLVQRGGRSVLVDAGAGGIRQWGGALQANLRRAGVLPSEIDAILLTHAHPDHVGGLLDTEGAPVFRNAELVVHQREIAFWQDDANLSRASPRARGGFELARAVFAAYRDRLRSFEAGEVLPGVAAVPLPGHTAGHCGYHVESEGEALLIWGDIVHFPAIQIARPEVSITFDQDPQLAAATRARLLDRACAEGLMIAGMHLGLPGFARVEHSAAGYALAIEGGTLA